MTRNVRLINADVDKVWDVLADGWLYPVWVVGASRMRDVNEDWPAVGSRIHHSIGVWPLLIDDHTEIVALHPKSSMTLRARGWPMGEAQVHLVLNAKGAATEVTIEESATAGPGAMVPEPLKGITLKWRNTETLRRLALIAENRA